MKLAGLFALGCALLAGKEKPVVETGIVTAVEYSRQGVGFKVVLYTVHAKDVDFEAAQYGKTAFSDFPVPVAKVGDTVQFQLSKNYARIQGKRMLLNKSSRRPK